jgi:hypothetical protein
MNNVSIYGETLAVIKELKKLGILKSSKSKKKRRVVEEAKQEAKQESDLVGYAIDNIPSFRPATADMSQSQIEDVNRRQAAAFATLKAEVEQQRLEDINAQQNQRFSDIQRLGTEINRIFTSTPEKPFDPFYNLNPIRLDNGVPDINEDTFSATINEGGPDITTQLPTSVFPETQQEEEIPEPRIQPREAVGKKKVFRTKREAVISNYGLPPIPKQKGSSRSDLLEYYKLLANTLDTPINDNIQSKEGLFNEIYRLIDEESESL